MKKLTYIFCIAFLAFGCQSDDSDSEQVNPDDLDGDGVTNQQEAVDNTDPNNPCSLKIDSQYYPSVSNAWKALDCDGDGVTNWKELDPDGNNTIEDNGTNPLQDCSLVFEDQTLEPKPSWLVRDCDLDGVSNEQEVTDGTNVLDWCDFILANQIEVPVTGWQNYDCDSDGYSNGREIEENTDPLNQNDFSGAGNFLKEVRYGNYPYYNGRKYLYGNDGTRFDKITSQYNDYVFFKHFYNSQDQLTQVFIADYFDGNDDINIYYTYTNNKISNVTRVHESDGSTSYDVVHDGNLIYTYNGTEPQGLFTKKFTFNNNNHDVLLSIESYSEIFNSDNYYYTTQIFEYDMNFENLLSTRSERIQAYNSITGEFYSTVPDDYRIYELSFNYSQDGVLNPFYQSYQAMRNNVILDLGTTMYSEVNNLLPNNFSIFSQKFMTSYNVNNLSNAPYYGIYNQNFEATHKQQNGLPTRVTTINSQGSGTFDLYYE